MRLKKSTGRNTIRDVLVWSDKCREHFLPWRSVAAQSPRRALIAEAGISDLHPGYNLGRTRPRFHLLVYTTLGRGLLITRDHTAPISPGYLLLVPAGHPFGYHPADARWRLLWYHLPDSERWAPLRRSPVRIRRTVLTELLQHATEGLLKEYRGRSSDADEAAAHYVELVSIYIERELGTFPEPVQADIGAKLHELWEAVGADLQHEWNVDKLASVAGMSASHLHRVCLEHTGLSPMRMVKRLRMERAQELLVLHDYPVARIAEMVGYTNEFAFSVAFKKFSGNTPAQFRKRR